MVSTKAICNRQTPKSCCAKQFTHRGWKILPDFQHQEKTLDFATDYLHFHHKAGTIRVGSQQCSRNSPKYLHAKETSDVSVMKSRNFFWMEILSQIPYPTVHYGQKKSWSLSCCLKRRNISTPSCWGLFRLFAQEWTWLSHPNLFALTLRRWYIMPYLRAYNQQKTCAAVSILDNLGIENSLP